MTKFVLNIVDMTHHYILVCQRSPCEDNFYSRNYGLSSYYLLYITLPILTTYMCPLVVAVYELKKIGWQWGYNLADFTNTPFFNRLIDIFAVYPYCLHYITELFVIKEDAHLLRAFAGMRIRQQRLSV